MVQETNQGNFVHRFTIVDQNMFGATLLTRVFTDELVGRKWAEAQVADIILDLSASGENLLDIDILVDSIPIDNNQMSTNTKWR